MSKGIKRVAIQAVAGLAVFALNVPLTLAQVPIDDSANAVLGSTGAATRFRDLPTAINTIFQVVIAASGAIFVLMFLFGGIQYLTSAGNEEGSAKARKLLVDAIVGLIIVLAAYALGTWILAQLGLSSNPGRTF